MLHLYETLKGKKEFEVSFELEEGKREGGGEGRRLTVHIVDGSEIIVCIVELSIVSFVVVVSLVGRSGEVVLRTPINKGGKKRSARTKRVFWDELSFDELGRLIGQRTDL